MLRPLLILAFTLLSVSGCSGAVTAPPDRAPSHAFADPQATRLGRILAPYAARHDGASGFSLVQSGPEALESLRSFIALAERTLDLQYYSWKADEGGQLLMADLIAAAKSGVRVRLLLDDMDTEWSDAELARIAALPNFSVRIFNPFANRAFHLLDLIADFDRVTHRMHNKLFLADSAVAMVGGRNVGSRYFATDEEANYRDIDLVAAGSVTLELARSFDRFWNSPWSIPPRRLREGDGASPPDEIARPGAAELPAAAADIAPARYATEVFAALLWARDSWVLVDSPDKPATEDSALLRELRGRVAGTLEKRLLIESAYLIPGKRGLEAFCSAVASGIDVRVLTNSLASTDAITAYGGYRPYRKPLLRCGVALYEMRPNAAFAERDGNGLNGSSRANLHSKAAVIDGRYVFIGSFNLDPRSVHLNTEIALLVDSPALAAVTARFIEDGMAPDNAYRLTLEDGEVVWHTRRNGRMVRLTEEPATTLWKEILIGFIGLLPIERQL